MKDQAVYIVQVQKRDHYNFPEKKTNKGVHIFHFISFFHHIHVQIQW